MLQQNNLKFMFSASFQKVQLDKIFLTWQVPALIKSINIAYYG